MPSYVTTARNTWTVTPLDNDTCIVTLDAQFRTRGVIGTLARWIMLAQLGRTSQHLGDDLRHYIENGSPSPCKQRQTAAGGNLARGVSSLSEVWTIAANTAWRGIVHLSTRARRKLLRGTYPRLRPNHRSTRDTTWLM